jgi:hypothetical protein
MSHGAIERLDLARCCYDYCNQIGIKITGIAEELKGEVNQNQSKQTIADPF